MPRPALTGTARQLIADHIWLADILAHKATRGAPDAVWAGDLHSAAYEGLMTAACAYNPDAGASFPHFASLCINYAIATERRHLITGRRNEPDRMAKALREPDDQEAVYNQDRRGDISTDQPTSAHSDMTVGDTVEQPGADPADIHAAADAAAADAAEIAEMHAMVARLSERDRRMIRHYYFDHHTLASIGIAEGVSESAIHQRLRRIREHIARTNGLRKDHQ